MQVVFLSIGKEALVQESDIAQEIGAEKQRAASDVFRFCDLQSLPRCLASFELHQIGVGVKVIFSNGVEPHNADERVCLCNGDGLGQPARVHPHVVVEKHNIVGPTLQGIPNADVVASGPAQIALVFYNLYLGIVWACKHHRVIIGAVVNKKDLHSRVLCPQNRRQAILQMLLAVVVEDQYIDARQHGFVQTARFATGHIFEVTRLRERAWI